MKSSSPREVAAYVAIILASLFTGLLVLHDALSAELNFYRYVVAFVLGGVVTYFVILYFLEKFIYQKIKLIYKTIHQLKTQRQVKVDMGEDVLSEVNREVYLWDQQRKEEIDRLQSQEKFRKEFIGNLAHELKTPVFSIQGYILTLLEGAMEDEKMLRKFLLRASKGVDRMASLIEELDEISKLESNIGELDLSPVDLVEMSREIVDDLEMKADKKNIQLRFNKDYNQKIMVEADRDKLVRVFINLIGNAISYGNEGDYVEVRFFDMDRHVLVEIADNGNGIDEVHLKRIFERFYRVDKSRSRNEGGSGLGLAIVKHILEAHEQSINVRSTLGNGTTFSFTLKKVR